LEGGRIGSAFSQMVSKNDSFPNDICVLWFMMNTVN